MKNKFKVLVVEDDLDVQEVIELLIQSNYDAEVTLAADGNEALNILKQNIKFDIITSDLNMPKVKGDQLYFELRKFDSVTPFILVSSEPLSNYESFKNPINLFHLDKPFTDEELKNIFTKALSNIVKTPTQEYIPIKLSVLIKIQEVHVPVYIKISENKYVKVLNEDAIFDSKELSRFEKKHTELLYIKKENFHQFLTQHQKLVFSKDAWSELNCIELSKELSIDLDLISKASKLFGWSPEVIELANKNIGKVIQLTDKNIKFVKVMEIFKTEKNIRLATHSIILTYLMTDIARKLAWGSELTFQKLAFAAILHDIDLDEDLFVAKQTLLQEGDLKGFPETTELKRILEHSNNAATLVLNWPLCPPDVDIIIRQHHEKPDGTGFPAGIRSQKISPLSALFILSEDIAYHCIENFGVQPKDYLLSKKDYYNAEPFRAIFKAAIELL
ncbi:MAG TPA: response regulator [Pseudobdellovibrionaceae bacterium]|nr:response regulator [Pseudobdellovibrionaceae bacterium]